MKNKFPYLIIVSINLLLINACNFINPKEPIPNYLQIDSVQMVNNPNQIYPIGTLSTKISEVYYDNQLLGAYELPARIPIINSGNGNVDIRAGIWNNGLFATRTPYPFYKLYNTKINFDAGLVKKITPQIMYADSTRLLINEDFEQGTNFINNTGSDTSIQRSSITNQVFEGGYSGVISLDTAHANSVSLLNKNIYLAPNQIYYLEINYKCDVPFEIYMNYSSNTVLKSKLISGFKAKNIWNKVYVELTTFALANLADNGYILTIYTALPSGTANANVYIDNLKIVKSIN